MHFSFLKGFGVILYSSICLISCNIADNKTPPARILHQVNKDLWANSNTLWYKSNDSVINAFIEQVGFENVTSKHPEVQARLQEWSDKIYTNVEKNNPNLLAPKPKVVLISSSEFSSSKGLENFNAFSAPIAMSFNTSFRFKPAVNGVENTTKSIALVPNNFNTTKPFQIPTINNDINSKEFLTEFFSVFNKISNSEFKGQCEWKFNEVENEVSLTGNCPNSRPSILDQLSGNGKKDYTKADNIVLLVTLDAVFFVYDGLPFITEEQAVGVLAHELGHYYHSDSSKLRNDFLYEIPKGQTVFEPQKTTNPKLLELGEKIRQIPLELALEDVTKTYKLNIDILKDFAKNFPELYNKSCELDSKLCTQSCGELFDVVEVFGMENITKSGLEGGQIGVYVVKEIFTMVGTCLSELPSVWPSEGLYNDDSFSNYLNKMNINKDVFKKSISDSKNQLEVMQKIYNNINASLITTEERAASLLSQAQELGLHWYTTEQLADDFEIEQLVKLGINPKTSMELSLTFIKEIRKDKPSLNTSVGFLTSTECRKLLDNNWLDANGKQAVIPEGTFFGEIHHGDCYRIYNMWREIQFHNYPTNEKTTLSKDYGPWPKAN